MATVYLAPAPTGSDSRTYAQAQNSATPWATLSKANTSASAGDTIICLDGTYTFASLTITKGFTLRAQNARAVIFDGGGADVAWLISTNAMTIEGIVIQNIVSGMGGYAALRVTHNLTLNNVSFKTIKILPDANLSGVIQFAVASGKNVYVNDCLFDDIQRNGGSGYGGIFATYLSSGSTFNVTGSTISCRTAGVNALPNLFYNHSNTNYAVVTNTIITNETGGTINWKSLVAGDISSTATYSDFYNITSAPTGTGVITSDPKLIDPTNGDFHLAHDSPALGMGTNL